VKLVRESFDIVVCGGGLAGFCAAVAAARYGAKSCLIHNRSVLRGNSSSEVGVTPHGAAAFHAYARETGIISEALIEERARNHVEIYENGWTNSVWDMVLYDLAQRAPNLTLHLNADIRGISDSWRAPIIWQRFQPSFTPEPLSLGNRHLDLMVAAHNLQKDAQTPLAKISR